LYYVPKYLYESNVLSVTVFGWLLVVGQRPTTAEQSLTVQGKVALYATRAFIPEDPFLYLILFTSSYT